jgi:hypothetical protein
MNPVARSSAAMWLAPAFLLTSVIPSLMFMMFATSSMGTGTVICDGLWITFALLNNGSGVGWDRREWRLLGGALSILILLFIQGLVVDLWLGGVNFERLLGSCVVMLIMMIAAYVIAQRLLSVTPKTLSKIAHFAFLILSILGFSAVAGLPSVNNAYQKPVIVFSEPSHFSFVYLPVLIFTVATTTRRRQFLFLGSGLFLGGALQNLTVLIGILGASCLVLSRTQLLLLLAAVALAAGFLALDLSYYADRLLLSSDSDNLSTLVYLQGWERAWLNIIETDGWGVGFQQFGFVGSLGAVLEKIVYMTHGTALNLYDGGSTGSKLIAELGALGVLLILLFLWVVARGAILIRRAQRLPIKQRDVRAIFFYSFIIAYASEVLIRGTGYLSPSCTFVLASLIAIEKLRVSERRVSVLAIGPSLASGSAHT